jgi:hypothetical protein
VRQFEVMRRRIRAKFWRDSAVFFVPASIVATPSIAICAVTARMDSLSANSAILLVAVLSVWTVIYLLAVFTLDRYLAGLDYLRWRSVSSASGRVRLGDAEIAFGRTFHWLHIADADFRLSPQEAELFPVGQACTVYYLRNVGIILSVDFP